MPPLPPPPPYSPITGNGSEPLPLNHSSRNLGGSSHDYSAYQQSYLGSAPVVRGSSEPSTSLGSPYLPTPLSTPDGIAQQANPIDLIPPMLAASAFYFEGRPPPRRSATGLTTYRLVIPPNARADQLAFPQPELIWLSRNVTRPDWSTFTNYLLPPDDDARINEKKALSDLHVNSSSFQSGSATRIPFARKPVAISPKSENSRAVSDDRAKARKETEVERAGRIQTMVAEWNLNFFEPRGVRVEEVVMPYSSALIPQILSSSAHGLHAELLSDSQGDETPIGSSSSESQYPQPSKPCNQNRRLGHAACQSNTTDNGEPGAPAQADVTSPSVQDLRNTSGNHVADVVSRSSSSNGPQIATPSTSQRGQASPTSMLSSSSTTSESLSSSNLDDLDDVDLKELRSAFAKFLLSSRSQEETAVALQELNQELQAQRQQTVKALKAEMKARRKDMKALTRQQKEEQRTERKIIKSAEKMRKKDFKTLRQEKKELKKRQKQARKEVKLFKKNAKKAIKGKKTGTAPYRGWLEALETNQEWSGTATAS